MFSITESAQTQIDSYFEGKEKSPIRIFLNQGCGGMRFAMALDTKKDSDTVFTVKDVEYLIDKDLLKQAQPIQVDFTEPGFSITSSLELGNGCSSCGSSGSCCS